MNTAINSVRKKRTILDLHHLKRNSIPITCLTAHDFPSARFIESVATLPSSTATTTTTTPTDAAAIRQEGIDICLIGDSLAMVACGYTSTNSLTLDELLYHCRSVARGCHTSLLVSDMPFGSFVGSIDSAVMNAVRIIQEGNMDAVKLEGGEEIAELVARLTAVGIPVMGHVGLKPQRQAASSGFRVQGRTVETAMKVWKEAKAIEAAGAFSIVLEAVPSRLASYITQHLSIPTIGIGAGGGCDGQVLVQLDMLGVSSLAQGPKFLKKYETWEEKATKAIGHYVTDVREGTFPEETHGYKIQAEVWDQFLEQVESEKQKS